MKPVRFNEEKNKWLINNRKVSFLEIVKVIENNKILRFIDHPNKKKYPNQRMFIVEINHYVYLVPFVEEGERIFMKTIIPSRKGTKKYLVKL